MGSAIRAIDGDKLTREVIERVIGVPMNLVECRLDGCARCVFQMR